MQLRSSLVVQLQQLGALQDFSFIAQQKGMFSFLGLNSQQVQRLIDEYSIYLVNSSRINIAGLNESNLAYVANSIAKVFKFENNSWIVEYRSYVHAASGGDAMIAHR